MYDYDEHVWLYAVGLVGEYKDTHTFMNTGLVKSDEAKDTLNDLDYQFEEFKRKLNYS